MVMPFQPFLIDKSRPTKQQLNVFAWDPELPIIFALIPRHDMTAPVRYIHTDLEPQYMLHTMSANVVGNTLTLDGPIFNRPPLPLEQDLAPGDDVTLFYSIAKSTLGRWTIDLAADLLANAGVTANACLVLLGCADAHYLAAFPALRMTRSPA